MPRGRQPNYDTRIGNLLDQLRDAIIAREKAAMDARVSEQVRTLVSNIGTDYDETAYKRLATAAMSSNGTKAPAPAKRRKRKPMSAAQKKAVGERMKKYWAERRAKKAKGGK